MCEMIDVVLVMAHGYVEYIYRYRYRQVPMFVDESFFVSSSFVITYIVPVFGIMMSSSLFVDSHPTSNHHDEIHRWKVARIYIYIYCI